MGTNNKKLAKKKAVDVIDDVVEFEDQTLDPVLEKYFETINRLDPNDMIHDERCKFCNSENRKEAEALWENVRPRFKPIVEFFKEHDENMSPNNVRTHLRNHYLRQEQLIMRRHYAEDRILPMLNHRINRMKRIEIFLAFLEDKAWKYAAMEHENHQKETRSDDMLVKITKEATNLIKMQAEFEGELKPVQIVIDKFQQIFVNAMSRIDDPALRLEMTKELESLREAEI